MHDRVQDRVIEIGDDTPLSRAGAAPGRARRTTLIRRRAGPGQTADRAPAGPRAGPPGSPHLPDLERALINPSAVFATPARVLDQPRLLGPCKREILRRWAWDEYLKEVAATEGMAEGEPSQLDAVKAALLALGETWRPKPSAPAAALPPPGENPDRAAA